MYSPSSEYCSRMQSTQFSRSADPHANCLVYCLPSVQPALVMSLVPTQPGHPTWTPINRRWNARSVKASDTATNLPRSAARAIHLRHRWFPNVLSIIVPRSASSSASSHSLLSYSVSDKHTLILHFPTRSRLPISDINCTLIVLS